MSCLTLRSRMLITACVAAALSSPVAAQVPASEAASIPTPQSVFGFRPGTDSSLFLYDQSIEYFRKLAQAQPTRVKLLDVGKTSNGHPWTAVLISSPQNLTNLERFREINQRLAHPDGLTDEQARVLAREGRAFVDISGGLHASEIAGSQHTPELAFQLLSRMNEPETKEILDNVIFFLWPSINPDGQDIVVNWCRERLAGSQTPMELYQKYVGHDNNRDSYMLNVVESRVVARTWREWEPQIIYAHHQSSPFPTRIWIPPFADPIGLYAPPIISRQINAIGMRIAAELDANGQPGATHMLATFDAYYPGYIDYMPVYQNINAWWTETQGGNCGLPRTSTLDDLPKEYESLTPTSMYSSPWKEGTWHFRDQVDYMVTASMATLRYAARFREELLYNRYQSGRNTIEQYRNGAPYAYIVPQAQYDAMAPVEMLRRLAFLGVRVAQLDAPAVADGIEYPKGTWVVPMDQEFAQLVRELLEVQVYPDVGDDLPYDAAGWTLPLQMNVKVAEVKTPLSSAFRTAMKPVSGQAEVWGVSLDYPLTTNPVAAGIVPGTGVGGLTGSGGSAIAVNPRQNNAFRFVNRVIKAGGAVRVDTARDSRDARYIVTGVNSAQAERWLHELAVDGQRTNVSKTTVLVPTRIALYKAAPGNMDQGWTEWLFDTNEYQYSLIGPEVLRAGNLGARFDVLVLASQSLLRGRSGGFGGFGGGQGAAAPTAEDSILIRAVDAFVRGGGTVVAWNAGATGAVSALGLPVTNVVQGVSRQQFFTGTSVMATTVDVAHPVMAGMPQDAHVTVSNSPVFSPANGFEGSVIGKYQMTGSPLRSGVLQGEAFMQGQASALDVRLGDGHVVLMGFQPQWRGQPTGTFRTIFNSMFFSRDAARPKPTPDFWQPPVIK